MSARPSINVTSIAARAHDRLLHSNELDPYKLPAFDEYARNWGQAIPGCGADLIGYFAPHEGSATTAYGVYTIADLAVYEAYRARLRDDPAGRENYAFSRRERCIRREDRLFLRLASAPPRRGRSGVFSDYRLRIAAVLRDYGMADRSEAPQDSRVAHGDA